jgi:hypothetical protein
MVPRAKKDTYQLGGANSQTYKTMHTHSPTPPKTIFSLSLSLSLSLQFCPIFILPLGYLFVVF